MKLIHCAKIFSALLNALSVNTCMNMHAILGYSNVLPYVQWRMQYCILYA